MAICGHKSAQICYEFPTWSTSTTCCTRKRTRSWSWSWSWRWSWWPLMKWKCKTERQAGREGSKDSQVVRIEIHLIEPSYCCMSPGSSSGSFPPLACTSVAATICWFMKYLPAFAANENPLGQSSCNVANAQAGLQSTPHSSPLSLSLSLSSQGGVAHNLLWSVSHLESCQPGNNAAKPDEASKNTRQGRRRQDDGMLPPWNSMLHAVLA